MSDAKRNVYIVSISFFFVFTAFSAIQNLSTSIISGSCKGCDEFCWVGNEKCVDDHQDETFGKDDAVCSLSVEGITYCAKYGGPCDSTCPNNDGGWTVSVAGEFSSCSSSNVGAIAIGVLYLVFTSCCLVGPFVVQYLRPKWSMALGFTIFAAFCCANLLVAQFPAVEALQWGLLVPASAVVGFAAAFLWTAQAVYVTVSANQHASEKNMDKDAVLGSFNGIFFAIFQMTQISGNLAASLLLNLAGWSNTALFLFYLCFACGGMLLGIFFVPQLAGKGRQLIQKRDEIKEDEEEEDEDEDDDEAGDGDEEEAKTLSQSVAGMVSLWKDRRLQAIVPLMMYTGFEQGFAWGDFTNNWVKASVGLDNIGYIMAAMGATDAIASFALGSLSDVFGRFPIVTFGLSCHLAVIVLLSVVDVGSCDRKWAVLIISAALWGVGDAVCNTQVSSLLGETFPSRKEDAFSNMKLWQSIMTSVIFFLNINPDMMSQDVTLLLVGGMLVLGYGAYCVGHFALGFTASGQVSEKLTHVNTHTHAHIPTG